MKNKIKKVAAAVSTAILATPAVALAQWGPGLLNTEESGLPAGTITDIVINIMKWILGIVGVIGVIGFAVAGILYLTAAGDEDRIETAKKAMTYCIIGVIVAILGYVIVQAASTMLGTGTNTTF